MVEEVRAGGRREERVVALLTKLVVPLQAPTMPHLAQAPPPLQPKPPPSPLLPLIMW